MAKGKTVTGFEFDVDEEVRDDMELLESLTRLDRGEVGVLPDVMVSLLGEEQKKRLYDHCRSEKGRVSSKRVMQELASIFKAIEKKDDPDLKN